jgi:hypothetical protein
MSDLNIDKLLDSFGHNNKTTLKSKTETKAPFTIDTVFQSPKQILENIKGVVFDMSNEDYHGNKEYDSSSRIKAVNITDWHFVNYDKIKPQSSAFAWGNLVHDDIESRTKTGNWKQWKEGIFKTITKIDNDKLEVHALNDTRFYRNLFQKGVLRFPVLILKT